MEAGRDYIAANPNVKTIKGIPIYTLLEGRLEAKAPTAKGDGLVTAVGVNTTTTKSRRISQFTDNELAKLMPSLMPSTNIVHPVLDGIPAHGLFCLMGTTQDSSALASKHGDVLVQPPGSSAPQSPELYANFFGGGTGEGGSYNYKNAPANIADVPSKPDNRLSSAMILRSGTYSQRVCDGVLRVLPDGVID